MKKFTLLTALLMLLALAVSAQAEEAKQYAEPRIAVGMGYNAMYDPSDARDYAMLFGSILFDYDQVWPHAAPAPLYFRVEGGLGASTEKNAKLHATANMFAVYYLDEWFPSWAKAGVKPYAEAGVGLLYRDYTVDGQGLRINFSPQIGLGTDVQWNEDITTYFSVRLHHSSNAGLNSDNRGTNGVLFQMGYYY